MKLKKEIGRILDSLYKYGFEEAYKAIEVFLNNNYLIYFKDYNKTFGDRIFFPFKINEEKYLSLFYNSSVGPLVIYHEFNRKNFDEIIALVSNSKPFIIKQKGDVLFEK